MKHQTSQRGMTLIFLLLAGLGAKPVAAEESERNYTQLLQDVFQTELVYPQESGEIQFTLSPTFREGDKRNILRFPLASKLALPTPGR